MYNASAYWITWGDKRNLARMIAKTLRTMDTLALAFIYSPWLCCLCMYWLVYSSQSGTQVSLIWELSPVTWHCGVPSVTAFIRSRHPPLHHSSLLIFTIIHSLLCNHKPRKLLFWPWYLHCVIISAAPSMLFKGLP